MEFIFSFKELLKSCLNIFLFNSIWENTKHMFELCVEYVIIFLTKVEVDIEMNLFLMF